MKAPPLHASSATKSSVTAPLSGRPAATRQTLLSTSGRLFAKQGVRAVSVDDIAAAAGITKTTLYRYFPAKDDLVLACLEEESRRIWSELAVVASASPGSARAPAIMRYFVDHFRTRRRGLFALNLAVEFPGPGGAVGNAIREEIESMPGRLALLLDPADPTAAGHVAGRLVFAIFGASAACQVMGQGLYDNFLKSVEDSIADGVEGAGGIVFR